MQTENVNPLARTLDISVSLAQFEAEVENRLKKVARTAKMQGFRPGKVPLKFVAQQYGGQVRQEVLDDSVKRGFADAVASQQLRVAGYPQIQPKSEQAEGQMEFTAVFEVYPEFQVGDLSTVTLERPVVTVGDAEIDKTIDILRKQRVTYRAVERAAANGDLVTVDYRGTLDGNEFAGGQATGFRLVLGEGRSLPDFEAGFVGMNKGESKEFPVAFPADYPAAELAGKTATFAVTLNAVEEAELPAVDADFAKALGVPEGDVAKLREEILGSLQREVKKRVQDKTKQQVMNALLGTTHLYLPNSLIDMEIYRLMEQMRETMAAQGARSVDGNLSPELFRDQAKRRVALGLILSEVVKSNELEAKPEQVRAQIQELAESYEEPASVVEYFYSNVERMAEVESMVIENNVVDWALTRMQVADKPTEFDELMGKA